MIYLLTLAGEEHRAEIEEAGPGRYRITLDGEAHYVSARRPEKAIYSIILGTPGSQGPVDGGRAFEANVDVSPDAVTVAIQGEIFAIGAIDERRKRLRAAAGQGDSASGSITSPMPGKVVKILAAVGAAVKKDQGVVVVEAMKMENELRAPRDGVVKQIAVTEGQTVENGALLMVIE